MKSRLDSLKRIEKLQKQLHDLSVWKLGRLDQQQAKLVADHRDMIEALGRGLLSFGGAASAATHRIRALEVEIATMENERAAQSRRALEHGAKSKLAEKAVERANEQFRQDAEKMSLAELIDHSVNSGSRKP